MKEMVLLRFLGMVGLSVLSSPLTAGMDNQRQLLADIEQGSVFMFTESEKKKIQEIGESLLGDIKDKTARDVFFSNLLKVPSEKLFSEKFLIVAKSIISQDMNGYLRAKVIQFLGDVESEKFAHEKFLAISRSFNLDGMDKSNRIALGL